MRRYLTARGIGRHFVFVLKRLVWLIFGRSRLFQWILRGVDGLIPTDPRIKNIFDKYRPDLVFTTVAMFAEMDAEILREAKRRHVPTVGMSRGWDIYTNSGIMRIVPDKLLVHNRYAEETAQTHQFISQSKILRVGFPRNDYFLRSNLYEPREEFLAKLGIDPKKRIIFFGAMENFWFPHDDEIARTFDELVECGKLPSDLMMLFRPYPGSAGPVERIRGLKHVVPDIRSFTTSAADRWEMREKETAHLVNSLRHSEMVVVVATTLAIDGMALDKPAISTGFQKTPLPYWFSAQRFLDHWSHWTALLSTGGVRRADTPQEFASAVREYLENPQRDADGRTRARKIFLEPYDGQAGERIAKILKDDLAAI